MVPLGYNNRHPTTPIPGFSKWPSICSSQFFVNISISSLRMSRYSPEAFSAPIFIFRAMFTRSAESLVRLQALGGRLRLMFVQSLLFSFMFCCACSLQVFSFTSLATLEASWPVADSHSGTSLNSRLSVGVGDFSQRCGVARPVTGGFVLFLFPMFLSSLSLSSDLSFFIRLYFLLKWPKIAPTWHHNRTKNFPNRAQMGPRAAQMAPRWNQNGEKQEKKTNATKNWAACQDVAPF